MNALATFLQSTLAERIGWMLVHSLWELTLVAGLYLCVRQLMHLCSAASRYLAACATLFCMLLVLPVTAWFVTLQMPPVVGVVNRAGAPETSELTSVTLAKTPASPVIDVGEPALVPITIENTATSVTQVEQQPTSLLSVEAKGTSWKEYLNIGLAPILPWIVALWLLGVVILAVRQLGGWVRVQRLCASGTGPVDAALVAKMQRIADALGISRSVKLLTSIKVEIPSVLGHLKPVILIPASLLTGFTPEQLEAILAHELAHICRHDYLINLIQSSLETLLFYHPAAWWVSREIRREREHCCDDLALQLCGDRVGYARSLTMLAERRTVPSPALAATGGSLINRIRRIVGHPIPASSPRGTWVAGALAILAVCFLLPLGWAEKEVNENALDLPVLTAEQQLEVKRLVEQAGSISWSGPEREKLIESLVAIGPGVTPEVSTLLRHDGNHLVGVEVLSKIVSDPAVQHYLVGAINEARDSRRNPGMIQGGLIALGKSGNRDHVDFVAGFLKTDDISAIQALGELGGTQATKLVIDAFESVPADQWGFLATALRSLKDPAAVPELKRRLGQLELPTNKRSLSSSQTVWAMVNAIEDLAGVRTDVASRSYQLDQPLLYPYNNSGAATTFSLHPISKHTVNLPKVDSETAVGRKAIWQALESATKRQGFTIDGDELVAFNGLKLAPLWPDGAPYPTTLGDWLQKTSHKVLLQSVAQEQQSGRFVIPKSGLMIALDPDGRICVLTLKKSSDQFTYNVNISAQSPLMQLVQIGEDTDTVEFARYNVSTIHDIESGANLGVLNLSRGRMATLTVDNWAKRRYHDAFLILNFPNDKISIGVPNAKHFLLSKLGEDVSSPEAVLSLLRREADKQNKADAKKVLHSDVASFQEFDDLQSKQAFAFAVEMPTGIPVAGIFYIKKVDRSARTIRITYHFLPTAAAREVFDMSSAAESVPPETEEPGDMTLKPPQKVTGSWSGLSKDQLEDYDAQKDKKEEDLEGGNISFSFDTPVYINMKAISKKGADKQPKVLMDVWSKLPGTKYQVAASVYGGTKENPAGTWKRIKVDYMREDRQPIKEPGITGWETNHDGAGRQLYFNIEHSAVGDSVAWREPQSLFTLGDPLMLYELFDKNAPDDNYERVMISFSEATPVKDRLLKLVITLNPDQKSASYVLDGEAVQSEELEPILKERYEQSPGCRLSIETGRIMPHSYVMVALKAAASAEMMASTSVNQKINVMKDGIYRIRREDSTEEGLEVKLSNIGSRSVVLLKCLSESLGEVLIRSKGVNNRIFRIDLKSAGPFAEGDDKEEMALVIGDICVMLEYNPETDEKQCKDLIVSKLNKGIAEEIATKLGVIPKLWLRPEYEMDVRFSPTKSSFQPDQPVVLKMKISNTGDKTFSFDDGGETRGSRNNQFDFTALRKAGRGKEVPDIGDSISLGGPVRTITLQPGEIFEKEVDLSKWFNLSKPDTYKIEGTFKMSIKTDDAAQFPAHWYTVAKDTTKVLIEREI